MLNINFWKKPAPTQTKAPLSLSFTIEPISYDKIEEEIDFQIKRKIVKSGNQTFYLFFPNFSEIRQNELNSMGLAKAIVIDTLSELPPQSCNDLSHAEKIACSELGKTLPSQKAGILSLFVAYDTVGYGPISLLLEDSSNLEEIEINSPDTPIYVYHSRYGRCQTNLKFTSEESFRSTINRFVSDSDKELSDLSPIIDVQVERARVHAQLRPYSLNGACATIRLSGRKEKNISSIISNRTANFETLAYLWIALENKANIVISGPPASGKTTLLSSLLSMVPRYKRVITIEEDVNEFGLYSNVQSVVSLYGSKQKNQVNTKEQAINALRMRPDLLVIGEIRGEEARELFSGSNFGVPFLTTMHANEGGIAIIKRLIVRPMCVEPQSISSLDISIQMGQKGVEQRAINEISEYGWLSRAEILSDGVRVGDDMVLVSPIVQNCAINPKALSDSKTLRTFARAHGLKAEQALSELKKRAGFLSEICKSSRSTLEIAEKLNSYGAL